MTDTARKLNGYTDQEPTAVWTKLIAKVWPGAVFNAPVSSETLRLVEKRLGQPLPDELESLLRHTDGVRRSDGTELVWSVERIIEDNDFFRHDERFSELYMPLEPLLFSETQTKASSVPSSGAQNAPTSSCGGTPTTTDCGLPTICGTI